MKIKRQRIIEVLFGPGPIDVEVVILVVKILLISILGMTALGLVIWTLSVLNV